MEDYKKINTASCLLYVCTLNREQLMSYLKQHQTLFVKLQI
jgi:hypothetical protein